MHYKLALAALALQQFDRVGTVHSLLASGPEMHEEEGLAYCDCRGPVERLARSTILASQPKGIFQDLDIDFLDLHEGLKPHHHVGSDSVVLVCSNLDVNNPFEGLFDGEWHALRRGMMLFLPRGNVHGFRRRTSDATGLHAHLLSASYPPIAEGDTHFVKE